VEIRVGDIDGSPTHCSKMFVYGNCCNGRSEIPALKFTKIEDAFSMDRFA
jgi:hypothetical protein